MDSLIQDLRYAARSLRKNPGFTGVALLTLALGIGANTTIFSVVDTVLLRPLPYADADRIAALWQTNQNTGEARVDVSPANFLDWRERSRSFEQMAAIAPYGYDLTGTGEPESLDTWLVSDGFFEILGVPALHGRTLLPEDYATGRRAVVISHGFWRRRFGADLGLIGRTLTLDGEPTTVVGIMPPEFQFPTQRDVWGPRRFDEDDRRSRGATYLNVVARLKPGVTTAQARAEMSSIAAQLAREYPRTNGEMGATTIPLPEQLVGEVRPALLVLLGAVTFVLLIACANVASLFLVRASGRHREFAIRAAVGAERNRLVRQVATESLLLAFAGGAGGVLLAFWGIELIVGLSPENLPRVDELGVDGRVLAFAFGVSVLTALLFGLAPALQSSRPDLQRVLGEGGRSGTRGPARQRLRSALVVAELALALVLLVGAGLLTRSFVALLRIDPGFAPENRAIMQLFVYDRGPAQQVRFFEEAIQRIGALPGVASAGATSAFPYAKADLSMDISYTVAGQPEPVPGQEPSAFVAAATPGYFGTLGIGLRRGRLFTDSDNADAPPVVVINETLVRQQWPGEDPIGKRIRLRSGEPVDREVVGVVADIRHAGLDQDPRPEVFLPLAQRPFGSMTLVARTTVDPATLLPAMQAQIWEMSPTQTIYSTATVEGLLSESLRQDRFNLLLLGGFALIALLLAAIGIYGLMSYSTRERTQEFGIRLALGARATDIVGMTIRQGLLLAAGGVALGVLGALALTRVLSRFLFGVAPTDPLTFTVVSVLLAAVALLAVYLPARCAARVDPMIALRAE